MTIGFIDVTSLAILLASGQAAEITAQYGLTLTLLTPGWQRLIHPQAHAGLEVSVEELRQAGRLQLSETRGTPSDTFALAEQLDTAASALAAAALSTTPPVVLITDDARTLRIVRRERPHLPLLTALHLLRVGPHPSQESWADLVQRISPWFTPTRTHPDFDWWQAVSSGAATDASA